MQLANISRHPEAIMRASLISFRCKPSRSPYLRVPWCDSSDSQRMSQKLPSLYLALGLFTSQVMGAAGCSIRSQQYRSARFSLMSSLRWTRWVAAKMTSCWITTKLAYRTETEWKSSTRTWNWTRIASTTNDRQIWSKKPRTPETNTLLCSKQVRQAKVGTSCGQVRHAAEREKALSMWARAWICRRIPRHRFRGLNLLLRGKLRQFALLILGQ